MEQVMSAHRILFYSLLCTDQCFIDGEEKTGRAWQPKLTIPTPPPPHPKPRIWQKTLGRDFRKLSVSKAETGQFPIIGSVPTKRTFVLVVTIWPVHMMLSVRDVTDKWHLRNNVHLSAVHRRTNAIGHMQSDARRAKWNCFVFIFTFYNRSTHNFWAFCVKCASYTSKKCF